MANVLIYFIGKNNNHLIDSHYIWARQLSLEHIQLALLCICFVSNKISPWNSLTSANGNLSLVSFIFCSTIIIMSDDVKLQSNYYYERDERVVKRVVAGGICKYLRLANIYWNWMQSKMKSVRDACRLMHMNGVDGKANVCQWWKIV